MTRLQKTGLLMQGYGFGGVSAFIDVGFIRWYYLLFGIAYFGILIAYSIKKDSEGKEIDVTK